MEFIQEREPDLQKPIVIAAMQDMGNVGSIVVDFVNAHLKCRRFRSARSSLPGYVVDNGGHISMAKEEWWYTCTDSLIIFGGSAGQPQSIQELHDVCQDVVDVAKKYSAKFIYTVGGFHTDRELQRSPRTFVTSTSKEIAGQLQKSGFDLSPQRSLITGFNGLVLGYAMACGVRGIGLYGELNDPGVPQYRAAKSVIQTLQKLTFQKLGDISDLDALADDMDEKMSKRWRPEFRQ